MSARPHYPKAGEPWFDCHICGFSYPVSDGMRHYKSRKLVDAKCADEMAQPDYQETYVQNREDEYDPSPQRVIS